MEGSSGLSVSTSRSPGVVCLSVAGEIDIATAPQLEAALAATDVAETESIVVDLSAVSFIDSTGLRCVLGICERSDRVSFVLSPAAARLTVIAGVTDRIPLLRSNVQDADGA